MSFENEGTLGSGKVPHLALLRNLKIRRVPIVCGEKMTAIRTDRQGSDSPGVLQNLDLLAGPGIKYPNCSVFPAEGETVASGAVGDRSLAAPTQEFLFDPSSRGFTNPNASGATAHSDVSAIRAEGKAEFAIICIWACQCGDQLRRREIPDLGANGELSSIRAEGG